MADNVVPFDPDRIASEQANKTPDPSDDPRRNRPTIKVEKRHDALPDMVAEAEAALLHSGADIYQRGHSLVRPCELPSFTGDGAPTLVHGIAELVPENLLLALAGAASWCSYDGRSKSWVACDPPAKVVAGLFANSGHWCFPPLRGIATTPTLRVDGSVLQAPGYDAATGFFMFPDPVFADVVIPESPSRADAEAALALLCGLMSEFPFVSKIDRAVALAALMTPILRGAIPATPLFLVTAPDLANGKTYLVDCASAIATGRKLAVSSAGGSPEEAEKRLVAALIDGRPMVSIDNCNGELGGEVLAQATEHPPLIVRPLGHSRTVEITFLPVIYATGNNIAVRGDLVRRCVTCRLDAKRERAEQRVFKQDPFAMILRRRAHYVAAVLTIARAYEVAGLPEVVDGEDKPLKPLASYAHWVRRVRQPLVWLGQPDPVASMETTRENDSDSHDLTEFLIEVHDMQQHGILSEWFFAQELVQATNNYDSLREILLQVAGDRQGGISVRRVGHFIKRFTGRWRAGRCLQRRPNKHAETWEYRVEREGD